MAGFSKIYCIGGLGGYMGADGINPILLQIWVGDASRQWLEAKYFDKSIKGIGKIKSIVPAGPDSKEGLLDACIVYYPDAFAACPTLKKVREKLKNARFLDFDLGKKSIPKEWAQLRKEAMPYFKKLVIFGADLKPVDTSMLKG